MCGIAGFVCEEGISEDTLQNVANSLNHRGPDAQGFLRLNKELSFVHTRLSFFDLSKSANQPMAFPEMGLAITFNGEIYNFLEIRRILIAKGYQFITESDTEVIIKSWHAWGVDAVNRLEGMFAFAIFDSKLNKLFLARDRFGIKPLYYTFQSGNFGFASELKALTASEKFSLEPDWSSVCDFMVYRYVPSPKSIYQDVFKLSPASFLEYDLSNKSLVTKEYWQLESGDKMDRNGRLVEEVNSILSESIVSHSKADVPVGMFLSGGYDSSAIMAYLDEDNQNPKAFSIGFENWDNSEDSFAQIVAHHFKNNLEKDVLNQSSLDLVKEMPSVYDEPIADISIIPTFLVSRLARKYVKAVMSGEGADEIFGGYWWQKKYYDITHPNSLLDKIKLSFNSPNAVDFYANAASMGEFNKQELKSLLNPDLHSHIPNDPHWFYRKHFKSSLSPLKQMQYMDIKCFMAELILVKVDRASMANSLEVRVPFLNHKLFELIFSYREDQYFKPNVTKYCLHQNIKDKLPKSILNREKQGFVGPDSYYMEKAFYQKVFDESSMVRGGFINSQYLNSLNNENYDWRKWKITLMDKWFKKWM